MSYSFSTSEQVAAAIAADPYLIRCVTKQMLVTNEAYEMAIKKDWILGEYGEPWVRQRYGRERIENAQKQNGNQESARENVRVDCEIVAEEIKRGYGPPGSIAPSPQQKRWATFVLERKEEREQYGEIMSEDEFDTLYLQKIS